MNFMDLKGTFVSMVLFEREQLCIFDVLTQIQDDWDIEVSDYEMCDENTFTFVTVDEKFALVSVVDEVSESAYEDVKNNHLYIDGEILVEKHNYHVLISVSQHVQGNRPVLSSSGKDYETIETANLYTKICASTAKLFGCVGVQTLGTVFENQSYVQIAYALLEKGDIPLFNVVYFGVYRDYDDQSIGGFTYGLRQFGIEEIEVVQSEQDPEKIHELLIDISGFVLDQGVTLIPGQSIGFSDDEHFEVSLSDGYAIDGYSIKIEY